MKSTLLIKQVADISQELKMSLIGVTVEVESDDSICLIYHDGDTTYSSSCTNIKQIHDTLNYIRLTK